MGCLLDMGEKAKLIHPQWYVFCFFCRAFGSLLCHAGPAHRTFVGGT